MHYWKMLSVVLVLFLSGCNVRSDLTQKERDYVNTHTVVWAAEDNYYPFVYVDRFGVPHGISVDYMKLISEKTGLQFRMAAHGQLSNELSNLRDGRIDLVTSIRTTPERSHYATFSRPYILVDLVMIRRLNTPKTVGVSRAAAAEDYLKAARKELKVVEFDDDEHAYKALVDGTIDSAIMDVISLSAQVAKFRVEFDKSTVPFEYPLAFATTKENEILRSILDKAITDMSDDDHEGIKTKWM